MNPRQTLYNALQKAGYQLPAFEQFDSGLNNPQVRQGLYSSLKSGGFQFDPNEMERNLSPQTQAKSSPISDIRQVNNIFFQPFELMKKGAAQALSTGGRINSNTLAGGMNIGAGMLQAPFTGVQAAAHEISRAPQLPFQPLSPGQVVDVLSLPGRAISGTAELLGKAYQGYAGLAGQTHAESRPMGDAITNLTGAAGQYAIPEMVGKVFKGVEARTAKGFANEITKGQAEIKSVAGPTNKQLDYDTHLKNATPYIQAEGKQIDLKSGEPQMRQAHDIVSNAADRLWNDKILAPVKHLQGKGATISEAPVGEAIRNLVDDNMTRHEPAKAKALNDLADTFKDEVPIMDVHNYITTLNAKSNRFYKASPDAQAMMLSSDPLLEAKITAADALREQLFNKLEESGVHDMPKLRRDYGSLSVIKNAIERKIVPSERDVASRSYYTGPIGASAISAAAIEATMHSPQVALAAGTVGFLRNKVLNSQKPGPTIARGFNRLTNTPANYQMQDIPSFNSLRMAFPPPQQNRQ